MTAFWINPNNLIKQVSSRHIDDVVKNPEWFGVSKEYVAERYKANNEPIGHEGKARSEIMRRIIQTGFVRARYTPKIDLWTFEVNQLTKHTKEQIWSFFTHPDIKCNKHSNVNINALNNNNDVNHKTNVQDILLYHGLFENSRFMQILEKLKEDN